MGDTIFLTWISPPNGFLFAYHGRTAWMAWEIPCVSGGASSFHRPPFFHGHPQSTGLNREDNCPGRAAVVLIPHVCGHNGEGNGFSSRVGEFTIPMNMNGFFFRRKRFCHFSSNANCFAGESGVDIDSSKEKGVGGGIPRLPLLTPPEAGLNNGISPRAQDNQGMNTRNRSSRPKATG